MSTKTREKEINEHGEEVEKPLFGPGSDEANTTGNPSDPRGDVASGDSSDPRAEKALSDEELSQKEEKSTEKSESKTDSSEKESLFSGEESPSRFSNFRKRLMVNGRRKLAIGGIVGVLGFGGVGLFGVIQGPLEFIHLSQLLQKYYTRSNENFGDDRSFKTVIYRYSGRAESGRLGIVGNTYADKLEKKLLETKGIRPIYHDDGSGRLAGYEIVDENKARQGGFLKELENAVPNANRTQPKNLTGTKVRLGKGASISPTADIVHFPPGTKAKYIRASTRTVVKSLNMNRLSTSIGTRVSVRRVGAKLHYLNGLRQKKEANVDAKTAKKNLEKTVLDQRDADIKNGVNIPNLPGQTKDLIDRINTATQGKTKVAADIIRKAMIKGAGPVAIVGALCTANDLGNAAQDTKFTNNVLPLIRNFWYFTSAGEQAKSGNSISLDELGVLKKTLYDKETGTSVYQAAPLQAEAGQKPTGADVPIEARPNKINNKPTAFTAVSKVLDFTIFPIPFKDDITIGTGCSAIDAISGLPGISQLSSLLEGAINLALGAIGTSTDELMAGVINLINGKAVDTRAVGGEAGALLGIGGKLAGIDQSLTAGGASMSPVAAAQLKEEQRLADIQDNQSKSLFARYLDPYESTSLVGATSVGLSGRTNPIQSIASAFSGLFSPFKAKASAAPVPYDYGIRDYGYTVHDQDDELFADPYANAVIVEPNLSELNDKYSKCFGIKATADDTGVHIESSQVNILKLEDDPEYDVCHQFDDTSTSDEAIMFKRYRFYLADAQNALSLACFEGDPNDPDTKLACAEINGGIQATTTTTADVAATDPPPACTPTTGPNITRWPTKPFDQAHIIRANFGGEPRAYIATNRFPDPVTGILTNVVRSGSIAPFLTNRLVAAKPAVYAGINNTIDHRGIHHGIDIVAPDNTPVYALEDGVASKNNTYASLDTIRVGRFEYTHLKNIIPAGTAVKAFETQIGVIKDGGEHVHLTYYSTTVSRAPLNPLTKLSFAGYCDNNAPEFATDWLKVYTPANTPYQQGTGGPVEMFANVYDRTGTASPYQAGAFPKTGITKISVAIKTGTQVLVGGLVRNFSNGLPAESENIWIFSPTSDRDRADIAQNREDATRFEYRLNRSGAINLQPGTTYTIVVTAEDQFGNKTTKSVDILG